MVWNNHTGGRFCYNFIVFKPYQDYFFALLEQFDHLDPNLINVWSGINLRSSINVRSGINVLVEKFSKNNKCTVWNNHTGGRFCYNFIVLKPYQGCFFVSLKHFDHLDPNLINVQSGIRSVQQGKIAKINKRTGCYHSSPQSRIRLGLLGDPVIQTIGRLEFKDSLRTRVLLRGCQYNFVPL